MVRSKSKSKREDARVPRKGWGKWKRAMVPDEAKVRTPCEQRSNGYGYFCESIKDAFGHLDCG